MTALDPSPHETAIRLALFKGLSPASKAIQWFTWGDYSHAAWWHGYRGMVTEAWKKGVQQNRVWLSHTPGTRIDLYRICQATQEQLMIAEAFVNTQLSKPYDWLGAARFVTRRRTASRWQKAWFCSELCFAALAHAGIDLLIRIPASKVSPTLLSYSPLLIYDRSLVTKKTGITPL